MPRWRNLPTAEDLEVYDPTDGCRNLVMRIFHRALLDAVTPGHIQKYIKRDATAWLSSKSLKKYSARWWAKEADLEHILDACLKVLFNKEKQGRFYENLSADIFRRRFGYRCRLNNFRRS